MKYYSKFNLDDAFLGRINIPTLRDNLLKAKWSFRNEGQTKVDSPDAQTFLVPPIIEFPQDLELLRLLARKLESLGQSHLLWDSVTSLAGLEDIVEVSAELQVNRSGVIPLQEAGGYYRRLANWVRSTYDAELRQSAFGGGASKATKGYFNGVLAGAVSEGSYQVQLHFPLSSSAVKPVGRRTWIRMCRSVEVISDFEQSKTPLDAASSEQFQSLITPKIARAMSTLVEKCELSRLAMECEPCPARSELLDNMQSMRVEYTFDHENLIEFLGKTASIVEQIPEKEPIEVIGYVHTLKNPDLARQTGSKVIFVTWERDGHDSVSLCVPLTDALYQKAIDAHKNQARIILRGFVERVGTRYWLQETTQLDFEFGNV